jgi:predicted metal-dependent hydrolase
MSSYRVRDNVKSYSSVTLNTALIRASKEYIDYIIPHEMCYLKYHDHSSQFYKHLDSVIPCWEKIKHKLDLSMV